MLWEVTDVSDNQLEFMSRNNGPDVLRLVGNSWKILMERMS